MQRVHHSRLTPGRFLRRSGLLLAAATICGGFATSPAEAQWGFGYGFNFNYQPPEIGFLNQRSLAMTNKATMGPVQNNVYANNPNAYVNRLREPGYLERYDIETRRSMEAGVARFPETPRARPRPAPTQVAAAQPPAAPASPMIPLSSFFDRYNKLVWPGVAPTWGDLGPQKEASDLACLAVLNEYNLRGLATLSNVTEARTKLITYGQPALKYVRENSTPRLADTFHLFLLSLYESLAQAATNPKQPANAAPTNTNAAPAVPN